MQLRTIFILWTMTVASLSLGGCDKEEPQVEDIPFQNNSYPSPKEDEAVDLGLSVFWAPYNVGASKSTEYGNYYAWGEIEPKVKYSFDTYKLDPFWSANVTGTSSDVAHVKWGGKWRIPTIEETVELVTKCKWVEKKVDGVYGMEITGPSGNSIFLPAAGRCVDSNIEDKNHMGHYWQGTATAYTDIENMYYYDLNQVIWGLSIRPVCTR